MCEGRKDKGKGGRKSGSIAEKAKYWVFYRRTDQETEGIRDDMEAN